MQKKIQTYFIKCVSNRQWQDHCGLWLACLAHHQMEAFLIIKCTAKWRDCIFKGWRIRLKTPFRWFPAATPMCSREEQRAGAPHSEAPPGRAHHLCSPKAHQSFSYSHTADWTVCTEVLQFRVLFPFPSPLFSLCMWSLPVWLFAAGGTSCKLFGSLLLPLLLLSCEACCWLAHMTPV